MGHYDECREGYCVTCGQTEGNCKHTQINKKEAKNMKSTGIVRRIDDLGRVVIPKEIRRNLMIKEGDPLEILIIDGMICFKRYLLDEVCKETLLRLLDNVIYEGEGSASNRAELAAKLKEAIAILNTKGE